MSIGLRLARPSDARVLARQRYEFRGGLARPTETAAAFVRRCTAWMRRALQDRRRWRCWVAVSNGEVVGQIWVQLIDKVPNPGVEAERHAYITNLYVDPAFRGGVGERLLTTAIDWCTRQRVSAAFLWPTDASKSLYARHGFSVSGKFFDRYLN